MNKIAAYEIALENIELEKRANYLVDAYGTCDGHMPVAYLQAFDRLEMEKEAIFQALKSTGGAMLKKVVGKGGTGGFKNVVGEGGKRSWQAQRGATLGDYGRFYGGKALVGMGRRPVATSLAAGAGVAGAGGLAYQAMK